jgi:hypothetical protein
MQKFEFLRQPLLGELAMSRKKKKEEKKMPFIVATYVYASSQGQRTHSARTKNAIYIGHLRLCQQPRAAHALPSDQNENSGASREDKCKFRSRRGPPEFLFLIAFIIFFELAKFRNPWQPLLVLNHDVYYQLTAQKPYFLWMLAS